MSATETTRPNGHDIAHGRFGPGEAMCPTCGQPITKAIQARIAAEEKARHKEAAAELHKAKLKAAEAAQKEVEKVRVAALAEVAQVRRQAQLDQAAIQKQVKEAAKAALLPKITEAVNAEKLRHTAEKLALEGQLADMQRKLQSKTAHQLGEPAEVDLFDALEMAFPDDSVSRVVKGQPGPDVIVEVIHGGEPVGKIVLDSKNHARWSNKFTSKLRSDQLAEGADFAILSTNVFPAGTRELHIQDNVIVASPQRVIVLTNLLRRQIIENHRLKLTAAARDEKAEKLLAYIVSPTCTDLLDRIVTVTNDMQALEAGETRAHSAVWKKRADLIASLQTIHREFSTVVSGIIAGDGE